MWYIKTDTLFLIFSFSILYTLIGILIQTKQLNFKITPFLIFFDLFIITYVSKSLALFYVIYTLVTYILVCVLKKCTIFRKYVFFAFVILFILPLIYMRMTKFTDALPPFIVLIGFAFNMLKAVDALYFAYYAKRHIPFLTYVNFLLFFPVFTAGPIFRYRDFAELYENPKFPDRDKALWCAKRFIRGLFKKLVIVPWLLWYLHFLLEQTGSFSVSFTIIFVCYALLHMDFSGYSDMAISVGTFVGIPVPENFDKPIKSATFTQFWHRWHISLSNWFREHVFILFSAKKLSKYQASIIIFFTLTFIGAWRGFTLLDISRGLFWGVLLALENLFKKTTFNKKKAGVYVYVLRCFIVSFFCSIAATTFFLDESQIISVLKGFIQ